jgi:signal transduction histidine kinase
MFQLVLYLKRIHRKLFLALARAAVVTFVGTLLTYSITASAAIMWSQSGPILVHNNGAGEDILHGAIPPQGTNSNRTLFLKFRVDPYSDAAMEGTGISTFYEAGVFLYQNGTQHLGIGNGLQATAYSAINVPTNGPSVRWGSLDFYTAEPELGKEYQCVRKGTPVIFLVKIEYIPGHDAHITVWLNPHLSLDATEMNQPTNIVTRFEANATFDEIRLLHRGPGDGWKFSNLAIASSFEDFIQPRFWQRKSFMGLIMGGLLVVVAITVRISERRRAQRQIRELEQDRAVAAERARIARDIHDELGASLTKICKLAEMMDQHHETQDHANTLSKTISGTARNTIQTMDEIVWAVNPKNDTLKEMADYLVFFTEDFLHPSGISCRLDVPLNLPDIPVTAEVRHNLYMVVKEALNNAVKHAAANQIRFGLEYTANRLTVEIADNGQGFHPDKITVVGNGLENMRRRISAIGGKFHLQSEPGSGTTVRLQVLFQEGKIDVP